MPIIPKAPAQEWLHSFLSPSLVRSPPYAIDTTKAHLKLDQNESPFDWPADLKQRISQKLCEASWNRYPSPYHLPLESLLAEHVGVSNDAILLSPGSNHLIAMLMTMLNQRRSGKLVVAQPSFALYEQWSQFTGVPYEIWPLDDKLQYDLDLLPALPPGSLLVFASPNNPVGNSLSRHKLKTILAANPHSYVVADEAYCEFAAEPFTPLLQEFANLILVRTFSKTMGAAGLRLGYCLAAAPLIEQLRKLMLPYLLNHFTVIAASEILSHASSLALIAANIERVIAERTRVYAALSASELPCQLVPSAANFLLLRWQDQATCLRVYRELLEQGILLRNVSNAPGLQACLRLTIGCAEENTKVLKAFSALGSKPT